MSENWHGVDVSVNARLRNGLTVQGGTSTGGRPQDNCEVRARCLKPTAGRAPTAVQTTRVTTSIGALANPYCHVVEPFLTSIRGLATYLVPKIDLQVSGTWRSTRPELRPTTSSPAPSRNRHSAAPLSSGNVTVNLVEPGRSTAHGSNNIDLRIAKIFRIAGTRAQFGVDVYNLLNTDVVTGSTTATPPTGAWLTPTAILPARYARFNMQFDF